MPYFVGTEIPVICWRQHEFNVEALDGRIEKISDDLPCYIVAHHPNKNWSYNVGIIKRVTALEGYKEVERLGRKKDDDKPSLYYELIPAEHYNTYLSKNDFSTEIQVEQEPVEEKKVIKSNPKPVVIEIPKLPQPDEIELEPLDISIKPEKKITSTETAEWTDTPKLVGESQKPLYTYKKPGSK